MVPFQFERPGSLDAAATALVEDGTQAIAGGTTMVDLMKLNVLTPRRLVSVRPVLESGVEITDDRITIAAGTTMADCADASGADASGADASGADADGMAEAFPALRQSLLLAATPQIRNMATMGGNLLQRTRSPYFRHVDMPVDGPPGSAPPAEFGRDVDTSLLALFGHGGRLVGTYPGDFAVVFAAFGGRVEVRRGGQTVTIDAADFYQTPGEVEHQYRTALQPGDVITAITFDRTPSTARSIYYKVRERSSYAFALASAAVGLTMDGDQITAASVALGGVGSVPWVSQPAIEALVGQAATDETFAAAAKAAVSDAEPPAGAEFKVPILQATIERALKTVRDRHPLSDEAMWAIQHGRG